MKQRADYVERLVTIGGLVALAGALVGAGITFGQHLHADTVQDDAIKELKQRYDDLNKRTYILEWSHDANHPQDAPLHIVNQEKKP